MELAFAGHYGCKRLAWACGNLLQVTEYLGTPLALEAPSSTGNGRAASWEVGMLDGHTEGPSRPGMAPYGWVLSI